MKGGSLLMQKLETGVEQVWEIESIELGAECEIGVVRMRIDHERARRPDAGLMTECAR